MIDPTSIAGLTLASCDALLKLGERTAQLIHDARSFTEDTSRLQSKVLNENTRTSLLRHVLFDPSPVYGGLALFQKFGEDAQDEIRVALDHVVHVLKEVESLLEKHSQQPNPSKSTTPTSSTLMLPFGKSNLIPRIPSPGLQWRSFPRTSIMLLRWSLHDKKRAEDILREFTNLNGDIHEKIKLLCLASDLGLNLQHNIQHLQRLQSDESSIQLGFNIDATLKLSARSQIESISLELDDSWNETLGFSPPLRGGFGLIEHSGRKYLLEHRPVQGRQITNELDQRTRLRMEDLARLLHQPKELAFCMPHCIGWKRLPSTQHVGFIFDTPDGASPQPTSLLRILGSGDIRLSLGERFRLALALSRCISQLQMVKWVHESFRSENILFFPEMRQEESTGKTCNYGKPLVLGFELSRPEVDFSSGFADVCLERDVYRHPERQGQPSRMFSKIHDIYALGKPPEPEQIRNNSCYIGVVLLEIGLWQRAINLEKNNFKTARDPFVIQAQLKKQAQRRLEDKMGEKYRDVVIKCLTTEFGVKDDTKEDLKLQQAFRTQVVDVLERAASNI